MDSGNVKRYKTRKYTKMASKKSYTFKRKRKENNPHSKLVRSPGIIHIFTDGACIRNGKPNAIAGYGVHFPHKEYEDVARPFLYGPITNQRAELYAIYHALSTATEDTLVTTTYIYTDSDYSINCLTKWCKGWKRAKWKRPGGLPLMNLDIIRPLYELYEKNSNNVNFIHVFSHTGGTDEYSKGNDVADKLALQGLKSHHHIEDGEQ